MKKIYVKPVSKVREMEIADGILSVTSVNSESLVGFSDGLSDEGDGKEDYARENNRNSSIWDQGW